MRLFVSTQQLATLYLLLVLSVPVLAAPSADLWSVWDRAGTKVGLDHSTWQGVLDDYVVASEDGVNRVRYDALRADGAEGLRTYIEDMAAIDPREFTQDEQMAYWINMYNALTIQLVLEYPKKGSILRMGKKFFAIGPWDDAVVTIAGESLTLNDIEHRILRPIWQDHRIHYAVNCASIGCPNLSAAAYTADSLEKLLQEAETAYLAHPRGVAVQGRRVSLSSIFKWYRTDFGATEAEVLEYIGTHHPEVQALLSGPGVSKVRYDYDWALNRVEAP